jgi:hypothetical protein
LNRKKLIILSEQKARKKHHVSYDTIIGMEEAFQSNQAVEIVPFNTIIFNLNRLFRKYFGKGIADKSVLKKKQSGDVYMYIAMGLHDLKRNRETLHYLSKVKKKKVAVYCFDTWEPEYPEWDACFEYIGVDYIFLSYYQSVDYFKKKYEKTFLSPQSADERFFHDYGLKKERLFMQMGRRTESIHQKILNYLKENGLEDIPDNYIYEREKAKIIFPETDTLAREINRSKYFVCAPQNLEWKKKTGNVSDVTERFYEAFACKTLIIGYKPKIIFDRLFPADAMVEIKKDGSDFKEKIQYFETHPSEYERLVNRNYQMFSDKHTWNKRLERILDAIN